MKTPAWLNSAQKVAKEHALSLPTKAKYGLNMTAFFEHEISRETHLPTFTWHGPEEIQLMPISQALTEKKYQQELEKHFSSYSDTARITSLHQAASVEGIVLVIPDHLQEDRPCKLTINLANGVNLSHIIIIAGEKSKNTLITETNGMGESICNLSTFVEANAQINHIAMDSNTAAIHFSDHRYYLAENAQLFYMDWVSSNYQGERHVHTGLVGAKSKAHHYHLGLLTQKAKYDLHTQITHQAPLSNSSMFARAVLDDSSHMIYRGMITVEDQAHDCVSEQKEATLILDPHAKIDAVPMLNIINDQVQCSHSASMSNFDPEKIFYMATRGLTPSETKQMLIQSFLQTDIAQITDPVLKTWLQDHLTQLLAS